MVGHGSGNGLLRCTNRRSAYSLLKRELAAAGNPVEDGLRLIVDPGFETVV